MENGSLGKVSYSHFMAVSCIVSDIIQDIGRKSGFFSYPLSLTPRYGVPVGIFPQRLVREN